MPGQSRRSCGSGPELVQARPLLEWLDDAFAAWDWPVDPGWFAPDVPDWIITPTALRRWLLATDTDYLTRDRIWVQVVAATRNAPDARNHRFLPVGLGLAGLRNYHRRIHVHRHRDLPDVHADLVTGFLTRLATIDIRHRNVAGRLIDSSIGYAARRHRAQQIAPPIAAVDRIPDTADAPVNGIRSVLGLGGTVPPTDEAALASEEMTPAKVASWARCSGARITDAEAELIAATRLEGRSLAEIAATLGIPVEAAYKRRRRAEQRVADALRASRAAPT